MANNRLPFGLCKKYHISLPNDATPKDAWEALKANGIDYFEEEESEVLNPQDFFGKVDFEEPKHITRHATLLLPTREYNNVIAATSAAIKGKNVKNEVVDVYTSNYLYYVEVTEFGIYRIIYKKRLK